MRCTRSTQRDLRKPGVQEYWTNSRQALALVGPTDALRVLVRQLRMSDEAIIKLSHSRSVLGLWGEYLSAYVSIASSGNEQVRGLPQVAARFD